MSEYPGTDETYTTQDIPDIETEVSAEYVEPAYEEIPEPEPPPEPPPEPEPVAEVVEEPPPPAPEPVDEPEPAPVEEVEEQPAVEAEEEPALEAEEEPDVEAEEEPAWAAEDEAEEEPVEEAEYAPLDESTEELVEQDVYAPVDEAQDAAVAPVYEVPGDAIVFDTDPALWSQEGLPPEWVPWTPEVEPDPASFTDEGYSTDWGTVEPAWAVEGESPFPVTEPEQPLTSLVGPGHALDVYWEHQGNTQSCALFSVASIIAEKYGVTLPIEEVHAVAEQNGWGNSVDGTYPDRVDDLLAAFGIPSHDVSAATPEEAWTNLNTALENNQRVVISVHGQEIWERQNIGDEPGTLPDANHALVITGVDWAHEVAILNDTGDPNGRGVEVPLHVVNHAWQDSGYQMIVTAEPMAPIPGSVPPEGYEMPAADAPGYAALPFTLYPTFGPPEAA